MRLNCTRLFQFASRSTFALAFLVFVLGIANARFLAQEIWQNQSIGNGIPATFVVDSSQEYSGGMIEPINSGAFGEFVPATSTRSAVQTVPTQVGTSNSTQQLQSAVFRLQTWLGQSGQSTESWRRFLLLNVLETQSALGEQASINTLNVVLARFTSGIAGVKHPAFNDVRIALEEQVKHLSASQIGDLNFALAQANAMYEPISIADMQYQRDVAVYELELLKVYYRQTKASRERAELFYDLQLEEAIEFLAGVEFELAPEYSVGKINSLIRDFRDKINDVEKKIDALPVESASDDEADESPTEDTDVAKSDEPQDNVVEVTPELAGPVPDGKQTREELDAEKSSLRDRVRELTEQKKKLAAEDKPRTTKRRATFSQLLRFDKNFAEQRKTLRDPYFASASLKFERFVRTYFYGTSDNLQEEFLGRLETLQKDFLEMNGEDSRAAAGKVGDTLRWMENANQLPNIVTAIRARHSFPNFYVAVSSNLVNRIGSQSIQDTRPVQESFQGQLIRGSASTDVNVQVEFQDDPNQIHASIHLTGSLDSDTYVQQRKITAYTNSQGQMEGRRSIYANVGGLFANDTKVAANVMTSFQGTSSRLRLINKIAAKKFGEVRAEGEATTARKTEDLLMKQFGEQTNEPIEDGKKALADAHKQLVSNGIFKPEIYVRSFQQGVLAVGKKSSMSTLAAPSEPARTYVPADIAVRLHETMLSNYLDSTFAGKKFTDKALAAEIGELTGEMPESLTSTSDDADEKNESFTITFSDVRPIQFEFEENAFRVVVSGQRFEQDGKKIDAGLTIALRFKIKRINGKLKFVRDGKAELDYNGEKTPKVVGFRSALDGKLNPKEGGQEIEVDLPENLIPIDQVEALQDGPIAKGLRLIQCRTENGWLYLAWNYVPEFQTQMGIQDTPAIWNEAVIQGMGPIYTQEDNYINLGQGVVETSGVVAPAVNVEIAIPMSSPVVNTPMMNAPAINSPVMNAPMMSSPVMNAPEMVAPPVPPVSVEGQLQR
ncbi:MAG: hypothetical protein AB8B55_06965 [Mariniblastus sp.]